MKERLDFTRDGNNQERQKIWIISKRRIEILETARMEKMKIWKGTKKNK